ncbi:MAG: Glutamate--tRNA ligase [Methanosaeta sp. PtaB.Bin039]|nr:MAG: Glutamate--tRNA ligase [Methanosaeta sp. PtaB.Bin039]HOT07784.1 glutamate--tRNA ligase [Methanotrichaceae archaeon]HQF16089.1 glutamate--tRNA ligase [Methanotrichaceae archaeon]HQI90795.1 glutamate--tRNA ligase [Methanotrichaceae archaeon]HQJ28248.1 glutamate--tRNA ligase [Methanotrichaceae archaeon]
MAEDIRALVEKYALQNAVKYKAAPNQGAVMGKLMGEHADLRPRAREFSGIIAEVLKEIAGQSPQQWEKRLEQLAPELLEELEEKKEPVKGLPALPGADGGVVMRFAPNPNGPPTLGSARGIIINSEYVKKYGGKFLIRFDDTDPVKKRPMPEAYGWYLEDCEWLLARPDQVITASERVGQYYPIAEELIRRGGAYVCQCNQEQFKALKDAATACPHRDQSLEENMELWRMMLDGRLGEGEAVLRIKTDIKHRDPAIRDWAAFRIVTTPHPIVGDRYRVWPLLDFESAVEDHLQQVTHILRGKDLMDSETRQRYLYQHMGWTYPRVVHWGRIKIHQFGSFSTSKLRKAIEAGEYTGWDDPRLPTVRAVRRRGLRADALRKFMVELGVGETDISISMDTIYAENRKLVDPEADRRFFVWDPVEISIAGAVPDRVEAPLHPTIKRGVRSLTAGNRVFVCRSDLEGRSSGDRLRLKDFCNVEIVGPKEARLIDLDPDTARKQRLPIIHWAPPDSLAVKVLGPERTDTGVAEPGIACDLNRVVQFERYGFVRIDSLGNPITACFAHR